MIHAKPERVLISYLHVKGFSENEQTLRNPQEKRKQWVKALMQNKH